MSQLSVLPAFNGADESSAFSTYSLCPDPDGHSIWALMLYWGNLPDNVPSGPDVQYNIVKIDLNTKQITKRWNYDGSGNMPLGCIEGSSFFFIDHAGMIWTAGGPAPGRMQQNDPNSGFALVNSFGQSGNSSAAEYLDGLGSHGNPSWVNWNVGGVEYMAYLATNSAWESMVVVCNLTTGHVVGNFWVFENFGGTFSDPAFTVELGVGDLFVDASGNLWWVMQEINSGGVPGASANAWFFKWNPSDGTKAQPIRIVTLADPFLNNVTWTVVPSSRYNSTGTWTSNGTDLRAQYIPSKNYVALGKAQHSIGSGFGGDVSILDMNGLAFTQLAIVPSADPAFMLYAPGSGDDIGAYQWQDNSKRQGISNLNILVSSSGLGGGPDAVGRASLLSSSDLSILKSFDLNGAVLAADPLYVAGFRWCYSWPTDNLLSGGQYLPGDMVTLFSALTDHLYIAKNTISYPAGTNPMSDPANWTDLAPGTSFPGGSGLVYRGIYDATVTYHAKDVVVREDYVGDVTGRPFTATADSVGVDPIVSGSDFWFPATNSPWYPWHAPLPNNRANCGGPIAHMLYYEALDILVWTYDFLGSPLYMLASPATGIIRVQKTVVSGTSADHTYPFTMRPSWKPPFTLIDGGSDTSTVPAGVYSITEDPVALINESISVSNGDPPSAIVIAGGSGNPIVNTTFWDGVLSGVAFPLSAPTSPGNGLIVAVCSWGPAAVIASIVTDAGDAFTGMPFANIPAAYNPTGGVLTTALFFLPAGLGGAAHMTIVSSFTMDVFVYEVIPGLAVDVAGFNDWKVTGDSQFPSMPPLVGTGAADLYIACLTNSSGIPATVAAPWTLDIPAVLPGGGGTAGFRAAHFVGSGSRVPVFDQSSSDHFSVSGAAFKFTPAGAIIVDVLNTRSVPGPPGGTSFVPKPPIGHGPFQVVPTDNSPNQAWQVSVNVNNKSIPLGVVLRYNEIAKYWVATISDSQGNVLLDSIPLITGDNFTQNILRQFAYLGIGSAAIFNASAKSA